MITKSRQKIEALREQPEEIRLRAAKRLTVVIGAALAIVSLAVLLPLQLYFTRPSDEASIAAEPQNPQVGGVSDRQPPTASPTPGQLAR